MIKTPLFFTIHNKNEVLLSKWPYPKSGNPLFTMTTSQRACKPVMTTRAFSRRNQHRAKALCWKSGGRKKVLMMLGYHSIQHMLSIKHDKSDFGKKFTYNRAQDVVRNHLFTLHTAAHADQRVAIPILHVKYYAQFLLGVAPVGAAPISYISSFST